MVSRNTARFFPGIQLYYPVVKPGETIHAANQRFDKFSKHLNEKVYAKPDTLIMDLEDGCGSKPDSRKLLEFALENIRPLHADINIAIRINQHDTHDYAEDLKLIRKIPAHIDVLILPKAGEKNGPDEIQQLGELLDQVGSKAEIQPIIESPQSLRIAEQLMRVSRRVRHVIFGIHDFAKALGYTLDTEKWPEQLRTYADMLSLSACDTGRGIIGGVSTRIGKVNCPPYLKHAADVEAWIKTKGDEPTRIVYEHAQIDKMRGWVGKQVIHQTHIHAARIGLTPTVEEIDRNISLLRDAIKAKVFSGGALKTKDGQMVDPPHFHQALILLRRAHGFRLLDPKQTAILNQIAAQVAAMTREAI